MPSNLKAGAQPSVGGKTSKYYEGGEDNKDAKKKKDGDTDSNDTLWVDDPP